MSNNTWGHWPVKITTSNFNGQTIEFEAYLAWEGVWRPNALSIDGTLAEPTGRPHYNHNGSRVEFEHLHDLINWAAQFPATLAA